MTKFKTLFAGAAAGAAFLTASVAAYAVDLTPTSMYQTYTSSADATPIEFTYDFTAPGKIVFYQELVGSTLVASEESPILMGSGIYDTHLKINTGVTVGYVAGPAPEPATWAMMLVGIGGVGAMARRRKASLAAA